MRHVRSILLRRQAWLLPAILSLLAVTTNTPAEAQTIDGLTLVDAASRQPIPGFDPIPDGGTVDLSALATREFHIHANVSGPVGSVLFDYGRGQIFRIQNVPPYTFTGERLGVGTHVLTVTPYSGSSATGEPGGPATIAFTISDGPNPSPGAPGQVVTSMTLIDTRSGQPVPGFDPLPDGAVLNVAVLGHDLAIRANTTPASVGSVRFGHNGNPDHRVENLAPYAMFGDSDGSYAVAPLALGEHQVTATPYAGPGGTGPEGVGLTLTVLVVDEPPGDPPPVPDAGAGVLSGEQKTWHTVTVTFEGPMTAETASPNPFRDYRLNVTFTQGNRRYVVPGYYAADGNAAHTGAAGGNKWRVHFVPDADGPWTYRASFRTGTDVAVSLAPNAGARTGFDGETGAFTVEPTDKEGRDHRAKGRLEYVGEHHLRFAETGEYFLKGGADGPENFLGYFEFDGTHDTGGLIGDFLHRFAPHAADWKPGDPTWQDGKGKNIIGALNYLASTGMNSVYFLTYNIDGGDGGDTWPWISPTVRDRFDVSKLDQWEIVFSHMDTLGIQLHVVTQETENDHGLDGGSLGDLRQLYYRELVARFAHHLAVLWNLGEENNNSDSSRKAFAKYIRALDPYRHPITFHTHLDQADTMYTASLGAPHFEATSIQGWGSEYNRWAVSLRARSRAAGRPWAVYGDEQLPEVRSDLGNLDALRKQALWGNLMGGGAGVEWYFGYQGSFGDVQSEDWRAVAPLWAQTAHALDFFQTYLPFETMEPNNALVSGADGALVLAREGEVYAVYLPDGGTAALNLKAKRAAYSVHWYNPRTGELLTGSVATIAGPGLQGVGLPPFEVTADWVALIRGL